MSLLLPCSCLRDNATSLPLRMANVPSFFDEVEDDTVLRILYNFLLVDDSGKVVTFDELGSDKRPARLTGTIVEPLPQLHKDKIVEFLSSAPAAESPEVDVTEDMPQPVVKESPDMDWSSLNIGSLIDGYCTKTMRWYEGKIMDVAKIVTEANSHGEATSFKVHFKGWNAKHDEWIDRGSPRLQPVGSVTQQRASAAAVATPAVAPRQLIPWYENTAIYNKAEELAGKIPLRRTMQIDIDAIDDWCMDFTYANPSMWLIDSSANIWYRVCGPLVPGGGHAHQSYSDIFAPCMERFAAAAHVAFCLIDFFPSNRKLSLGDVIAEVTARTRGRVDKPIILQNFEFICEHVASLSHPDDWDKHLSFEKSLVIQQLRKKGEALAKSLKLHALTASRVFATGVPKSILDMSAGGEYVVAKERSAQLVGKNSLPGDPMGTERTHKGKPVLIDDEQLWSLQTANGHAPRPFPLSSTAQTSATFGQIDKALIPRVLKVWAALMNFRTFLGIPYVRLEDFVCLLDNRANKNYVWCDASTAHPLLREIHVALMVPMIDDRSSAASFTKVHPTPQTPSSHALDSFFDRPEVLLPVVNSVTIWEVLGCSHAPVENKEVAQVLRAAECWVEVGRLLLSEKVETVCVPEYADPVGEMQELLESLLVNPCSQPFTHEAGKICVRSDGKTFTAACPDDLTCILDDIRGGQFECGSYSDGDGSPVEAAKEGRTNSEDCTVLTAYGVKVGIGDRLDVYSNSLRAWSVAKVICILPLDIGLESPAGGADVDCLVQVTFEGWNSSFDETYGSSSPYLAPHDTLSRDFSVKHTHPDSLPHGKTFQLAKTYRERGRLQRIVSAKYDAAAAIVARVRTMLEQARRYCDEFPDGTLDLLTSVEALEAEFDQKCSRMNKAMYEIPSVKVEASSGELADIVSVLGKKGYSQLAVQHKLLFLEWLCNEMMSCSSARRYLEEAIERRYRVDKEHRQKNAERRVQEGSMGPGETFPQRQSGRASRSKRPLEGLDMESDEDSDGENAPQHKKKVAKLKAADKTAAAEATQDASDEELMGVDARLEPIGRDRNGTLYWMFGVDEHPHRVFCEQRIQDGSAVNAEWLVLSSQENLKIIAEWLSEFGQHESRLKAKLLRLLGSANCALTGPERKAPASVPAGSDATDKVDVVADSPLTAEQFEHARYYKYWMDKELTSYFHLHALYVTLTARGHMEVGVKDLDGRIIVTAYKENETDGSCCSKEAGMRLGDHIVSVNGRAVRDITTLQIALKSAAMSSPAPLTRVTVMVMVLRHPNPVGFQVFKVALVAENDPKQVASVETKKIADLEEIPTHLTAPRSDIPTSLCGIVMQMVYCARCTYATSKDWAEYDVSNCAERIARAFLENKENCDAADWCQKAVGSLAICLLRLENALFVSDRVLAAHWKVERLRYKWRSACLHASNFAMLSVAAASLYSAVDWESLEHMSLAMERSKWLQLVPKSSRVDLPGQRLIYYADGEFESREFLSRHMIPDMPLSHGVEALRGSREGVQCKVNSARHYAGGPVDQPSKCFPYVRLELRIVARYEKRHTDCPRITICPDPSARRTRILNRILNVLYSLPESAPFLHPVDKQEAQDYYDVIKVPMDISEMVRRVKIGHYDSLDAFLRDVELIRSNCVLYCKERYPVLIPLADILLDTASSLVEKLRAEFAEVPLEAATPTLAADADPDMNNGCRTDANALFTGPDHPLAGKVIVVHAPLHKGLCEHEYVIDMDRYSNACSRPKYQTEDRVVWKKVRDGRLVTDGATETENIFGSITGGAGPVPPGAVLPWKWLHVEWDLLDDYFSYMNPWEVTMMKKIGEPSDCASDKS